MTPLALVPVETDRDILPRYRKCPIGDLLALQNLGRPVPDASVPDLVIVTCMDHRVILDLPTFFAFCLRTAGATPMPVISNIAFAVGTAGARNICVVGHTDCAMGKVDVTGEAMVEHLVDHDGWTPDDARAQLGLLHEVFRIDDPVQAAWTHARHLAERFPSCVVAPLLYRVEDGKLVQID